MFSNVSYTYSVTRIPGTRAQQSGTVVDEDGETRTIFQRAGIGLHVHVSGQVGQWSIFSVIFGVVFPVVVGGSVVDVMMYMLIAYAEPFKRERAHLFVDIHDERQQPSTPTSGTLQSESQSRCKSE